MKVNIKNIVYYIVFISCSINSTDNNDHYKTIKERLITQEFNEPGEIITKKTLIYSTDRKDPINLSIKDLLKYKKVQENKFIEKKGLLTIVIDKEDLGKKIYIYNKLFNYMHLYKKIEGSIFCKNIDVIYNPSNNEYKVIDGIIKNSQNPCDCVKFRKIITKVTLKYRNKKNQSTILT